MARLPRFDPRDSLAWVREPERSTALRQWHLDLVSSRGWLVAGSGALAVLLAYLLGRHEMMALGFALVSLVLCAWLLVRFGRLVGNITRTVPQESISVGDVVPITLHCPDTATIREVLPAGYSAAPSFQAPGSFEYEIVFRRRGVHRVGPAQQLLSDPCGLVDGLVDTADPTEVPVRAHCIELGSSTGLGERMLTGDARHNRSTSADYYDVGTRDYQQGDSMRQVHWKATARHGKLMVRQENFVATAHCLVIMDRRGGAWHAAGDLNFDIPQGTAPVLHSTGRFEKALSLACSIGELYARHGYQLMVRDVAGRELNDIPGQRPAGPSALDHFEDFHAATAHLGLAEGPSDPDPGRLLAPQLQKLLLGFADEPVFLVLGELDEPQARWLASLARTVRNVELFLISSHPERYRGLAAYFAATSWRIHLATAHEDVAAIWGVR